MEDLSNLSMFELFRMEVETQIAPLNDNLLVLESQPQGVGDTSKRLESLMRAAHSIKGAARIVGIDPAVRVAHAMEDCFVAAQNGSILLDAQAADILLQGVDWFAQLQECSEAELPQWLEAQSESITDFVNAIATLSPLSPLSSPSPLPEPISQLTTTSEPTKNRVIRVNADNLNQLMALAGESLVEANWLHPFIDAMQHLKQQQQALSRSLDSLQQESSLSPFGQQHLAEAQKIARNSQVLFEERLNDLEQFFQRFSQLSDNLYREVITSHMRPFADGVQVFPRMVRDLAKQLGKAVKLEIIGQTTQVDRDILEKLEAPLTQMLRNAIVHGIEPPDRRQARGKPEMGIIRLEASHRAGMLAITVSDDGCGIDVEELRRSVAKKQLATPDLAARLNEGELLEFLFLPGFSTAEEVTEIAGRGVGLDIAKSMVQEVGGLLRAISRPGEGLAFHFQLPLTLSVIRALLVEISGEPYAFGLTRIDRVLMVNPQEIATSENRPYIAIDEENISLVKAQQVLELPETGEESPSSLSVVVIRDNTHRYGLIVDRFLGERNLVVRPLDPRLGKVQDISAAAVTEDGLPLLIIDVADLVRSIDRLISEGNLSLTSDRTDGENDRQKRVLVVDDSITVREMERKLLQNRGYHVDVAVDGMEGWNAVRAGNYDLVITDIDMPRMNGIELIRQIKSHPQLKSLPTIVVSYKDRQEDQIAGLDAGADYYLTKSSFHDNSLLNAVTDTIG